MKTADSEGGISLSPTQQRFVAVTKRVAAKTGTDLPVLEAGSPEWNAWRGWRKEHGLSVVVMESRERWTVPTKWPPASLEALEAEYGTGGLGGKLKG